jgi:hypothetical protein
MRKDVLIRTNLLLMHNLIVRISKIRAIPAEAGIQEVILLDSTGFRIRFGMDDLKTNDVDDI